MEEGTKLQKKWRKRDANAFKRFAIISTFIFMKFVYVCQPKRQKKRTQINKYICIVHTKMKKHNMENYKGNTLCEMARKQTNERTSCHMHECNESCHRLYISINFILEFRSACVCVCAAFYGERFVTCIHN